MPKIKTRKVLSQDWYAARIGIPHIQDVLVKRNNAKDKYPKYVCLYTVPFPNKCATVKRILITSKKRKDYNYP